MPRSRYFRENLSDKKDVPGEVTHALRVFCFAEFLRLSSCTDFDTIFLSVALVVTTLDGVPLPPALPALKRLVLREGLYEVSPLLIGLANNLQWLEVESDEVVRSDG